MSARMVRNSLAKSSRRPVELDWGTEDFDPIVTARSVVSLRISCSDPLKG